jgi:hypothetical protein
LSHPPAVAAAAVVVVVVVVAAAAAVVVVDVVVVIGSKIVAGTVPVQKQEPISTKNVPWKPTRQLQLPASSVCVNYVI